VSLSRFEGNWMQRHTVLRVQQASLPERSRMDLGGVLTFLATSLLNEVTPLMIPGVRKCVSSALGSFQ
jgi:hypothetical protein